MRALWGSTHPGPSLVVTVLAVALGLVSGLEPWRLAVLAAAVLLGQLSVGLSNDALDALRDRAVGRRDKPVARGEIAVRTVWAAAVGALAAAAVLSAFLGIGMLVAHAVALASAWSYNAWLKATPLSIVPFVVSFGIFPSFATLSAPAPTLAAAWAWAAGGALGAAVHLVNVLPDLDDDRRTGIRGLPHRLGVRGSAILAALCVVAGAAAVLLGPVRGDLGAVAPVAWIGCALVAAAAVATVIRALSRAPGRALFRLVMLAALLLAALLVVTGRTLSP